MDHYLRSDARLEASVSFGRFEKDVLSWEKWSSFSPNKYLEEIGSLSTPGSVAQKKAYFEAHYKKIAAQKAKALEQEKLLNSFVGSDSSEAYDEPPGNTNGANVIEQALDESCLSISPYDENGKAVSITGPEPESRNTTSVDNAVARIDGCPKEEEKLDELNGDVDHSTVLDVMSNADLNLVSSCEQKFRNIAKKQSEQTSVPEKHVKESNITNSGNTAPKGTKTRKEKCLTGASKKVVSPSTREFLPASRNSKPLPKCASISSNQYLKKKTGTQQTQGKNSVVVYKKGLAPTSLHMSMNLGPANSLGDHSTMRSSLIMEKLGNKEIVRTFRTFQKGDVASSSSSAKKPTLKHETMAAVEQKMSVSLTPVKVNDRLKKDPANTTPSGARSNTQPSRSGRMRTIDPKYGTSFSPSTSTNDNKAEKRKEFLKKLEANSIARASQNRSLNSKASASSS